MTRTGAQPDQDATRAEIERIAAVLGGHRIIRRAKRRQHHGEEYDVLLCSCLWEGLSEDDHRHHVAESLLVAQPPGAGEPENWEGEILLMIVQRLEALGTDMKGSAPMFYDDAIEATVYRWCKRALAGELEMRDGKIMPRVPASGGSTEVGELGKAADELADVMVVARECLRRKGKCVEWPEELPYMLVQDGVRAAPASGGSTKPQERQAGSGPVAAATGESLCGSPSPASPAPEPSAPAPCPVREAAYQASIYLGGLAENQPELMGAPVVLKKLEASLSEPCAGRAGAPRDEGLILETRERITEASHEISAGNERYYRRVLAVLESAGAPRKEE